MNLEDVISEQKEFLKTGNTRNVNSRKKILNRLYSAILKNEDKILEALNSDLGKSGFEAYITEIGIVLDELNYAINNVAKWARPEKVGTSVSTFPAKSRIYRVPYGCVLIISPWNYPFHLAIIPLISAIAAGNTVILKPSRKSIHTTAVLREILEDVFDLKYVYIVDPFEVSHEELLSYKYDYIFFTGSVSAGKSVMAKAAETLTPVTLELGGKSPAIVDENADIDISAKRIVWGKFINAGQTCVAPDYVLCYRGNKDKLIGKMKYYIKQFYGEDPLYNSEYPKIIDEKAYLRLKKLISGDIVFGGKSDNDSLKIEPTIIDNVEFSDEIMKEEIFGPILPILTFEKIDEVIENVNGRPSPLAVYIFTKNKAVSERVINEINFGGGCVNDCLMHIASNKLPFGGVGESGMGAYHGKSGFLTFSHAKSIVDKNLKPDIKLRYPPAENKLNFVRKFMGGRWKKGK